MKKCYFCERKASLRITGAFRHQFVGHIYETDDSDRIKDIEANGFFGSWFIEISSPQEGQEEVEESPKLPIEEMKFPALRALAKERRLPGYGKMKKVELIAELKKKLEVSDG